MVEGIERMELVSFVMTKKNESRSLQIDLSDAFDRGCIAMKMTLGDLVKGGYYLYKTST